MVYKKCMVTSTPLCSSREIYNWLSGFINLERGQNLRNFCLDRMIALAKMAGSPEKCAPSVHVAGSKGKGSVTGMIASILEASGMKISNYASPHVYDFRERLTMGSNFFDEKTYVRAGNELKDLVDAIPSTPYAQLFDPGLANGENASFFELMTLWFFLCSRLSFSQAMTVETGLGGRLDATNILDPLVSVITRIELEHTEYLGNTIAAISAEKAGIIKTKRPLILAEQSTEALDVFREHAAGKKSPLFYFPDCVEVRNVKLSPLGTSFALHLKDNCLKDTGAEIFPDLFVPIPGEIQASNAGLAVLAAKIAFPGITEQSIRKGLSGFTLPARFERISDAPLIIADGAHTPLSIENVIKTFTGLYGEGAILIFGCATGKDIPSMAELCIPRFSRIIITTPGTFKKSNPQEIYTTFIRAAQKKSSPAELLYFPDTAEAVARAINLAHEHRLPILGTGSFYLAGEIKKLKACP